MSIDISSPGGSTAALKAALRDLLGMLLIDSGTISSPVSNLQLDLPSGYSQYLLELINITPSVSDALGMSMSQDGGSTWPNNSVGTAGPTRPYISNDGLTIVGGGSPTIGGSTPGGVFVSRDGGNTWSYNALQSGSGSIELALSRDGTKVFAVAQNGGGSTSISSSSDGGVTWSAISVTGATAIIGVCCSSDGSIIYASDGASAAKDIFKSTNGGSSWSNLTNGGTGSGQALTRMSCSDDGSVILGCASNGHTMLSTNSGSTWTDLFATLGSTSTQYSPRVSSDGTNGAIYSSTAAAGSKGVWVTSNFSSWTQRTNGPLGGAGFPAISTNGSLLAAVNGSSGFHVFTSTDMGANWTDTGVVGTSTADSLSGTASLGTILRARNVGLSKSTDSGASFSAIVPTGSYLMNSYVTASLNTTNNLSLAHLYVSETRKIIQATIYPGDVSNPAQIRIPMVATASSNNAMMNSVSSVNGRVNKVGLTPAISDTFPTNSGITLNSGSYRLYGFI